MDATGRLVVAGFTQGAVPFPTTQPANSFVQNYVANGDGFVVALDASDNLRWGTCLGDDGVDRTVSVRVSGSHYVVFGSTDSEFYWPIKDGGANAYDQDTLRGFGDLTLAEFDLDGGLQWSTYIGGAGYDYTEDDISDPLAVDGDGNVVTSRLLTPEGYTLTADSALTCATRALSEGLPAGFLTPSRAFGAD